MTHCASILRAWCPDRGGHALVKAFAFLLLIYFAGIFSILRANRLYLDDIGRALYGYADWATAARPLAELLSWLFFLGPGTVDASPFTQILAAAFLAAASLALCLALRVKPGYSALLATVPVGLSPYGLENLSYKFDAPFMAFAILLAVLPFLFFHRHRRAFFISALLGLFCSASIYQAALGVYLAISGYLLLLQLASRKKTVLLAHSFLHLALPFILAAGAYAAQASLWFKNKQYADYVTLHSTLPPLKELPAEVADNIVSYAQMLYTDWSGNALGWLLAALTLWFGLNLFLRWLRNCRRTGLSALVRLALLLILLACFLLAPLGVQILLQSPVWSPRTFCGFGVTVALMLLALRASASQWKSRAAFYVLLGLLCLQLGIFSQVYGNLLAGQGVWERSRIALLVQGLSRFIAETDSTRIVFTGSVGQTPLITVPARHFPLLERMVSVPLTSRWRWGYEQLKIFGVYVSPGRALRPRERLTMFMDTPAYRLELTEDGMGVVTFRSF